MELGELNIHIGDGNYSSKYPKNSEFLEEGVPFISASDFQGRVFIADGMKHISEEQHSVLLKGHLKPRDILVVVRGNGCGKVGFVPAEYDNANINAQLALLRCDNQTVNSEYLYYLLSTNEYQNKLKALCSGSAQPQLPIKSLKKLQLELPKYEMQLKIAGVAKLIDDKMLNNAAINRNLSDQAVAIYRELILDATEDCSEGILSDVADIIMGQSPKGDTYNENGEGAVFYQGRAEFGDRFPTRRLFTTDPKRMAKENSVLMSVRAPVGDVNVAYEECCIGRGLCSVASKDNHQSFVLYTMYSLKEQFDVYNGEGTVFGSINKDSMNGMAIQIPNKSLMDKFEEIVSPMDAIIKANYEENCRLIAMRDSLLPKLMSGELDVSDLDLSLIHI